MAPAAVPKKPGVAGIVCGVLLMVLGPLAGAIVMMVGALGGVIGGAVDVLNAPDFVADASDNYVQADAGTTMAFWFPADTSARCAVVDPNGDQITPRQPVGTSNANDFQTVLVFDTTVTGLYNVACQSDGDPFNYRVAPSLLTPKGAGSLAAGGAIIGITFILGLALLIFTIVRRSNWAKTHGPAAQAMMYPPQQPVYPPQQPPVAYPPQGYPPQQPPPAYPPQQ